MNFYAWSAAFVCLSSIASGAIVLWKNPRGKKNLIFQPFALSIASWSFFYVLWQVSETPQNALLYIRLSIACAACIPATNFHAILEILDANNPRRDKIKLLFYFITVVILISSPTPYFISRVEPKFGFPFWPVPGPVIHLHFINLFIPS